MGGGACPVWRGSNTCKHLVSVPLFFLFLYSSWAGVGLTERSRGRRRAPSPMLPGSLSSTTMARW
jgi:hypothetical protein